ncbi:MAG: UDP-4-amino-4,6-dideoxy-N-acetyl-beta-L-altrosamine transaminase [Deltaproteobacteria bacterium]|nr:UDP-4-amino-4,6-dideoxy-N-acetyl-beta-L-altrosamine transaminase [Deltaproteobacteria bacterium]
MPKEKNSGFIPYGRQWIDEDDIRAVARALSCDYLTQGPGVERFEEALAGYLGARFAVAVSSGTAALHLACLAVGVKDRLEAITTPITFAASANSAVYCGGKPVFADIEPHTFNINPDEIRKKITARAKAVIPVHFAGLACDMDAIRAIADERGLTVIEDACHALGAEYKDLKGKWHKAGSCAHSDLSIMSFHPVKHITTGEGGAILTNSPELYERLMLLRTHGITKKPDAFKNKAMAFDENGAPNPWYYEMQEAGFNYRLTDLQCALGISQLKKLDAFVARRRRIADIYSAAFKGIDLITPQAVSAGRVSSYHLYAVQIDFKRLGKSRARIMTELKEKGIGTQVHYIPVHLQPFYRERFGCKKGDFPVAEAYYEKALSLPMYPKMTDDDVRRVVQAVTGLLKVA